MKQGTRFTSVVIKVAITANFGETDFSESPDFHVGSGIGLVNTRNEQTPLVRGLRASEQKKQGVKHWLFCFLVSLAAEIAKPFVEPGDLSFCA